LSHILLEHRC